MGSDIHSIHGECDNITGPDWVDEMCKWPYGYPCTHIPSENTRFRPENVQNLTFLVFHTKTTEKPVHSLPDKPRLWPISVQIWDVFFGAGKESGEECGGHGSEIILCPQHFFHSGKAVRQVRLVRDSQSILAEQTRTLRRRRNSLHNAPRLWAKSRMQR